MPDAVLKAPVVRRFISSLFCIVLAACGGGGGSDTPAGRASPSVPVAGGEAIGTPSTGGAPNTANPSTQPPAAASGLATAARFNSPDGIAFDASGNLYVVDSGNHAIRKITREGAVTTLAGTPGVKGSADGAGAVAQFNEPSGIAADAAANLYVADTRNHTIRKITAAGVVTTLAGTAGVTGSADGVGKAAQFNRPFGVAADAEGNLYVADTDNYLVRRITPGGMVSTLAGTRGMRGAADGPISSATFRGPFSVTFDAAGNLYVTDAYFYPSPILYRDLSLIRKITATGMVSTLAGGLIPEASSNTDGVGAAARFHSSAGITADPAGDLLYIADTGNHIIRKVAAAGAVTTMTFSAPDGSAARFSYPRGITMDAAGNLYIADAGEHVIRKVTPGGVATTYAGKAGEAGSADMPLP